MSIIKKFNLDLTQSPDVKKRAAGQQCQLSRETEVPYSIQAHKHRFAAWAARPLNEYVKSVFVCAEHHHHDKVKAIHPPIDDPLLDRLIEIDFHNNKALWRSARKKGWSKLNGEEYRQLIGSIKDALPGKGPWEIDEFWRGYQ